MNIIQIKKHIVILSMLIVSLKVIGQNQNNDIFSDSVRFAEYVYINTHYSLMDLIEEAEGTTVYQFDIDSLERIVNLQIISSSGNSRLDAEAKRLINATNATPWGERVKNSTRQVAINFKLADNKIHKFVDSPPKFSGGRDEMLNFIGKNLRWPPEATDMGVSGTVYCGFIIEKDGSINIVEVVRSLDPFLDAEAVRVIKRMPKWIAGKKNGKPVRVYFVLPIRFSLR